MQFTSRHFFSSVLMVFLVFSLAACSLETESVESVQPPTPVVTPPAVIHAGFLYSGSVPDKAVRASEERAMDTTKQNLLAKNIALDAEVAYAPTVVEAEEIMRNWARSNKSMIFVAAPAFADVTFRVATDNPTVHFAQRGGVRGTKNLATFDIRDYQAAYLAGYLAGATAKGRFVGMVGDTVNPHSLRNLNAFTLGVMSANPNARTKASWVGINLTDAAVEAATQNLIDRGAGIILQNVASPQVFKITEAKKVPVIAWEMDGAVLAPQSHLMSVYLDWSRYYSETIEALHTGNWEPHHAWLGKRQETVLLNGFAANLKPDLVTRLQNLNEDVAQGRREVFEGPLHGQFANIVVVPSGKVMSDVELKAMNQPLRGIFGDIATR